MLRLLPFFVLSLFLLLLTCAEEDPGIRKGRLLADQYCGSCHLVPEPDQLNRSLWISEVLPKMGAYFGHYAPYDRAFYLGPDQEKANIQHLYPLETTMDTADWRAIREYFINAAPDRLEEDAAEAPPLWELEQFAVREISAPLHQKLAPLTTLISFHEESGEILVGGPKRSGGSLDRFTTDHRWVERQQLGSAPSAVGARHEMVLEMGSLLPSDFARGSLTQLRDSSALLENLARPVDVLRIDLDLNGQEELIIAEYGNLIGRLSRFEESTPGKFLPLTPLAATPGAIRLRRADLNADGHDDLVVLFAQGDERIDVWYSHAAGPKHEQLLRFPPSYGSSDLEIVDVDGDGKLDLVYANGDNFDYQPVPKIYHGIRVFLHRQGQYREEFFYPMDGVYGLKVTDFDGDGDQDIAAVAYYVPPAERSLRSFVYLEQLNFPEFRGQSFRKPRDQYYMCMTRGDVDGDGDQDLLLGNFAGYLPDGMPGENARTPGQPAYLLLENRHR